MAKQVINIGRTANDRSGDPLRSAFIKINDNFTELYTLTGGTAADLKELAQDYAAEMFTGGTHSGITVEYNDATNKINLTVPAETSRDYNDLTNKPDLSVYALTTDIPNVSSFITAADIPAIPADISDLTDTTGLLGQGGTANTGDIQFLDSEIFTTTGNLTFYNTGAPEGEFNRIDFESDRFTVDVSQDINLTAGTDLELTVNNASGSAKTFTFGTTGGLTFPDATIQSSAFTGIAKSVIQAIDSDATINTSRNVATNNLYTNPTDFVSDLIPTGFDYVFAGLAQRNETQMEVTLFVPPAGIFQTFLTGLGLGRTVVATYSTASGTSTITGTVSQGFQVIGQYDPTTGWIRVTGRIDGIVPTGYTGLVSINFPIYNTESYTWAFNDTGGLTFPDNTVQTTAYTGSGTANTGDVTFNGVKIIGAGTASGDGFGYSTLELVPDNNLYANDQYLVVDPTQPNHIHIRAGGTQDASNAIVFLGGEKNHVRVQDNDGVYLKNEDTFSNSYYYVSGADFTDGTWYVESGNNYIRYTQTGSMMDIVTNSFGNNFQNTVQLYDGTNYFTLTSVGYQSNLGGGTYVLGVAEAPTDNITVNINTLDFNIITFTSSEMYLANNDFRVDVADDVRIIASDLFRLINNSTTSGVEITTDDNNASHTWYFGADGNLTLPTTSQIIGDIVTVKGSSSVTIKVPSVLNPFDTKDWGFDAAGRMSFPDGTLQTTAYTGRNTLTTVAKTGAVAPLTGEVATVTQGTLNNTNLSPGTYAGLFLVLGLGFTVTVIVSEIGDIGVTVTASNGGFQVGDQAIIPGSVIGGTTGVDDLTVTVETLTNIVGPTELDVTKSVQKLTDGYYSLADGAEGQVIHLVRQDGSTAANIFLTVANGRANGTSYSDIAFYPFNGSSQPDMVTLLFTDSAWQSNNGQWD